MGIKWIIWPASCVNTKARHNQDWYRWQWVKLDPSAWIDTSKMKAWLTVFTVKREAMRELQAFTSHPTEYSPTDVWAR